MIVADSGPLIAFSRIGRLDILKNLFDRVLVPDAVFHEVVVEGMGRPGAQDVATSVWIERRPVKDRSASEQVSEALHAGERDAISLAQVLGLTLLIDERRGRRHAECVGVEVFGSLRVLVEARRRGIIDNARILAEAMIESGYWLDRNLLSSLSRPNHAG